MFHVEHESLLRKTSRSASKTFRSRDGSSFGVEEGVMGLDECPLGGGIYSSFSHQISRFAG
jgi:hypothetical protein